MSKLAKIMSLLGLAAFLAVSFVPPTPWPSAVAAAATGAVPLLPRAASPRQAEAPPRQAEAPPLDRETREGREADVVTFGARFARSAAMSGVRFANGARTAGSGALAFRWAWLSFARLPAPPPMSS